MDYFFPKVQNKVMFLMRINTLSVFSWEKYCIPLNEHLVLEFKVQHLFESKEKGKAC